MTTSYDLSELQALLHTLPARLRLVADYVSREAAAELLDECATRLEAQRDRLTLFGAALQELPECACRPAPISHEAPRHI